MLENGSAELNIAVETGENLRKKSDDLKLGYDEEFEEWELIVKCSGSLKEASKQLGFAYVELLAGFAIVRIAEKNIEEFERLPEVLSIDKPHIFYEPDGDANRLYEENRTRMEDGILRQNEGDLRQILFAKYREEIGLPSEALLDGKGVLIGIVDSGIDTKNPIYYDENENIRIDAVWDQNIFGNPPEPYGFGTVYESTELENMDNSQTLSGEHGNAVASVVAALATGARLLCVKTKQEQKNNQASTLSILQGIDFCVREALKRKLPLVMNISLGNNYGDHAGGSILEEYVDAVSQIAKLSIVIGAGNEANTKRHQSITFSDRLSRTLDLYVANNARSFYVQIYASIYDAFEISIMTPTREQITLQKSNSVENYVINQGIIKSFSKQLGNTNSSEEFYIMILPQNEYVMSGIWKIILRPQRRTSGPINLWLPVEDATTADVIFLESDKETTLTNPSTAKRGICVGAYDDRLFSYTPFSGIGYAADGSVKPDLVAPGVEIPCANLQGGISYYTGTSFATPLVSVACAMLMEWGITSGRDPFLFGERLKAALLKGCRTDIGNLPFPNPFLGNGRLNIWDAIQRMLYI